MALALKEEINQIIEKRKAKLPKLKEKYAELQNFYDEVQEVNSLKNQMLKNSERMSIDLDVRNKIEALNLGGFDREFLEFKELYKEVESRFSKNEINIAVVGAARQGKSRLLQSISNLDNKVIPAFEADDCTGATSIIKNVPGRAISAEINFMTESEMVECVQKYLDEIFGKSERLDSFRAIRSLDIERLKSKMEKGSPMSSKFEHLRKYVEHFDEWSEMVDKGHITVTDVDEIQKYVAQHNGKNEASSERKNYYLYLAVKDVTISCPFRNEDAGRVVLRDTIGLGDTSLGIKDKMIAAIREHSDAAIIVRRPEVGTGKLDELDNEIYSTLYEAFMKRNNMDKWLFWLVNKTSSSSTYGSNEDRCKAFEKRVNEMDWKLAGHFIVDVSDEDAVNNIFSEQILKTLTRNIDEIDAGIINDLNEQIGAVYEEYRKIQNAIEGILLAEGGKIDNDEFLADRWKAFYERTLMKALKNFKKELSEKKDSDCEAFQKRVKEILRDAIKLVPSQEILERDLSAGGRNRPFEVYSRYLDKMRNDFTEQFLDMDKLIFDKQLAGFKERIVDIFAEDDCGRLKHIVPLTEDKTEWLGAVAEQLFDRNRYSQFKRAFLMVKEFQMTVRGFLMHRIRSRIDRLDPEWQNAEVTGSNKDIASYIRRRLEKLCREVCDEIDGDMEEGFYKDPNRILYAVMAEFYDRINFSYTSNTQNVEEVWRSLYRENCQKIWREEFTDSMEVTELYNKWSDMVTRLKKHKKAELEF